MQSCRVWRSGLWTTAAALAAFGLAVPTAYAQSAADFRDLRRQVQQLEGDVQDLKSDLYGNGTGNAEGLLPGQAGPRGTTTDKVNEIESSLRSLTGQIEDLSHRIDELSQRMDRMQNELQYNADAGTLADGGPPFGDLPRGSDDIAASSPTADLAPGPGVLGTLPDNDAPPRPTARPSSVTPPAASAPAQRLPGGGNPDFETAMGQVTRGQYDLAYASFRAFADQNPDDPRAGEALWWAGDISYSAKKNYPDAADSFAKLLKGYPKDARAPEGMLKLGLSLLAMGQKNEGCLTLDALPKTYPGANAATKTRARAERTAAACK